MNTTPEKIVNLAADEIFVFGSNKDGRHGKGAAKQALYWGAKMGIGEGISGHTYAIPTRQWAFGRVSTIGVPYFDGECSLVTLSLNEITEYVDRFISYAAANRFKFLVTEIGCNNAGYQPKDIAPLFCRVKLLDNVFLPKSFWSFL
jgi:hypothetical protein